MREVSDIQGSIRPTQVYGMANLITLRDVLRMVGKPVFNHRVCVFDRLDGGRTKKKNEDVFILGGGGTEGVIYSG